ncbi:MAG TPA: alpha/beta hydrolase [Steroidobacteraceae bacterium]|nr:alpha/beta hydrolase [Steroidobacteraceae bacterium]
MNLLSIGTAQRRLFAIHEAAAATAQQPRAIVLCQPWAAEYTYAHRTMRQLSLKLSLAGWHTLRFDYYGTGDSGGDEAATDLRGCEADVECAMEALADIAGTRRVALTGLRLGANIAASVAARRAEDVPALALWDPIISGKKYLESLRAMPKWSESGAGEGSMAKDVEALQLQSLVGMLPERSVIVVTDDVGTYDQMNHLGFGSTTKPSAVEYVPAPCPWVESATTTGILPVPAIQRVVEWLR